MRTVEIKTFEQVILYKMQQKVNEALLPVMTFSDIWSACSLAGPRLPKKYDPNTNRPEFSRHLFETLDFLSTMDLITVRTTGNDKIDSISLTDKGCLAVQGIIFSHQDRIQGV
jgi:hypothetical protein